ncbi:MAG TPA: L,D-transpeptidase family protein [Gaiellaceae bacterium]|jgi:L,D-peptidoglycan transpeptidase YkuD (ErfK/YbiS/YcfS/YnhG family)|nr:L,D-transpeptidase family protein [Gaiellaceae bacterium]
MSLAALIAAGALLCPGPSTSQQLVTVQAPPHATVGTLTLWQETRGSCFKRVAGPWRAQLGSSGLSAHKREGDGATPTGTFRFGPTMYGVAPSPGVSFAYHRLTCGDWWDEDPSSAQYNRFEHVACGATPSFGGGSEALWRIVPQYRYFAVIEYNAHPVVRGRGSAIFLHVSSGRPTAGCISLPVPELLRTLRWLRPGAIIRIGLT